MKKELKVAKNMNFVDVVLLVSIGFISTSLSFISDGGQLKLKPFLESINNNAGYWQIFSRLLVVILTLFLVTMFRLEASKELTNFFSANRKEKRKYFIRALRDMGFRKGEILKKWPFYLVGIVILGTGAMVMGSFNEKLFSKPELYFFLTKASIILFMDFLVKALIFFMIFDYFVNVLKSLKLSYLYSALLLLFVDLIAELACHNMQIVDALRDSFVVAPWMMAMYYWADNSIYYSWILMSTFQTLGMLFYAIQFNIFKI